MFKLYGSMAVGTGRPRVESTGTTTTNLHVPFLRHMAGGGGRVPSSERQRQKISRLADSGLVGLVGLFGLIRPVGPVGLVRPVGPARLLPPPSSSRSSSSSSSSSPSSSLSPSDTPWDVLGVAPDSSERAIKAAHRRLVLEHHPDRVLANLGRAEEGEEDGGAGTVNVEETKARVQKRFMRIQEAYEMLMGRRHVHMGSSAEQGGWNFHDFFWSFNYHRRKKEGNERARPPPPAGSWKGQMENLKRRAAARRWKKARQAPKEGWFGNIMNAGGSGVGKEVKSGRSSGGTSGGERGDTVGTRAVSSQLEGLRRKAQLKKTILKDE